MTLIIKRNLFFFIPFLLWVLVGGVLLFVYTRSELFFSVNTKTSLFFDQLNTVFSAYGRGDIILLILTSLLLIPAYRHRNFILTGLTFGIAVPALVYLSKMYFNAPRPLKYYGHSKVHTVPWLDNLFEHSFPSGHTIGAFGFFLLLSLYLPKNQKPWSLLFFLLAMACGYSRMYLGQHFFADVYAGSIVGTLVTFVIFLFGQHYIQDPLSKNHTPHA